MWLSAKITSDELNSSVVHCLISQISCRTFVVSTVYCIRSTSFSFHELLVGTTNSCINRVEIHWKSLSFSSFYWTITYKVTQNAEKSYSMRSIHILLFDCSPAHWFWKNKTKQKKTMRIKWRILIGESKFHVRQTVGGAPCLVPCNISATQQLQLILARLHLVLRLFLEN